MKYEYISPRLWMRAYQPRHSIANLSMIGDADDDDLENGDNWIESTNPP